MIFLAKRVFAGSGKRNYFLKLLLCGFGQGRYMPVCNNQEVSGGIGEKI
jgi:hypothetical protein